MRLIDADKLRKDILDMPNCYNGFSDTYDKAMIVDMIDEQPSVDAVPVIRCSECKFVGTDATCCLVCKREGMGLKPYHVYHDDYCSYAERKDNGKVTND